MPLFRCSYYTIPLKTLMRPRFDGIFGTQHLSSDDSLEHGMDGGSDDDLGMDTDYEYESDSSLEGIQSYYYQ